MSHVKEIIIFSFLPSFFFFFPPLPLSKSIIYSRYNAWIGQILSAWAPLLWQGLERGDGNCWVEGNEFWGFEYVTGVVISGGMTTVQLETQTLKFESFGDQVRKNCVFFVCFFKNTNKAFKTHTGDIYIGINGASCSGGSCVSPVRHITVIDHGELLRLQLVMGLYR